MEDEDSARVVEGEVVREAPRGLKERARTFFHPLSGAVILGLDWLAFGTDLVSGFALTAAVSLATFALVYAAVYRIQTGLHGDARRPAVLKAFLGALAAGVPFPVTGTVVGAAILALSGLPTFRGRGPAPRA